MSRPLLDRAAPYDALAIVAFVLAFVVPPAGIVCGHLSLRRISVTGERGSELALAGTILGYAFTVLLALFVVVWIGVLASVLGTFLVVLAHVPVR